MRNLYAFEELKQQIFKIICIRIVIKIRTMISYKNNLTYSNIEFCLQKRKCNIKKVLKSIQSFKNKYMQVIIWDVNFF